MKLIRNSVYETNSSSCHSLSVLKEGFDFDSSLVPDSEGTITIMCTHFGWQWGKLYRAIDKAAYAYAQAQYSISPESGIEKIEAVIKEVTCATNIEWLYTDNAYVDHDSEGITTGVPLKDLIFNKNIVVFLGNDNGEPPRNFRINSKNEVAYKVSYNNDVIYLKHGETIYDLLSHLKEYDEAPAILMDVPFIENNDYCSLVGISTSKQQFIFASYYYSKKNMNTSQLADLSIIQASTDPKTIDTLCTKMLARGTELISVPYTIEEINDSNRSKVNIPYPVWN